jgi:hypothetical protein
MGEERSELVLDPEVFGWWNLTVAIESDSSTCELGSFSNEKPLLIGNEAQKKHLSFVPKSIVAVVRTRSRDKMNAIVRRP